MWNTVAKLSVAAADDTDYQAIRIAPVRLRQDVGHSAIPG